MRDVEEVLDRQHAFLQEQDGANFFAQLRPYLEAIRADPRAAAIVDEMLEEADALVRDLRQLDARVAADLVKIRHEVTQRDQVLDDSKAPRPPDGGSNPEYQCTFAYFDEILHGNPPAVDFDSKTEDWKDNLRSTKLLPSLRAKLRLDAELADRLPDLSERLRLVEQGYHHGKCEFLLQSRVSPAIALARLVRAEDDLNPEPDPNAPPFQLALSLLEPAHRSVFEKERLDQFDAAHLKSYVETLRRAAKRSYEEIRRRLYTRRSYFALINRFKIRCETYDRDRLRALTVRRNVRERPLNEEAARFLFDNGLTPLIGPQVGGLRPDILPSAEWTFYVESKQYERKKARQTIRDGAYQIWSTAGVLRGLGLREVFWLVFRRGGRQYVLPTELKAEGLIVFPIHIDIADIKESGSRQRLQPRAIEAEELLPSGASSRRMGSK